MKYIPTIGLEIHAELKTKSKMFCACFNDPLEQHPNLNICPICMGHPGTLPVANGEAINKVIKVGLALGCSIPEKAKFDRKSYFYPDLPKGYQISQYDMPFCVKGVLRIEERDIRITRVHLEEDTGKLIHPSGADYSLVDFNRAGVPLMELVTEPDIQNALEASAFAKELQLILRYLGASDADMEKGQLRVEVNISLSRNPKLGTKVEVKNLNSFRAVEQAIKYEIKRQTEVLESGGKVVQETRGWNDAKGETFSQREKESAHDYRYFPEPDLPPFHFTKEYIDSLRSSIPELPQARKQRLVEEYKLSSNEVEILVQEKDVGEYFEKVVSELGENIPKDLLYRKIKLCTNYILSDLLGLLQAVRGSEEPSGSRRGASVVGEPRTRTSSVRGRDFLITPENFAELINLIDGNRISSAIAKQVLKEMFVKGGDPSQIIEERGLAQINDEKSIKKIAKEVIEKNPKAVEDYKKGKENALQFLVGQIMSASRGTASPDRANQILHNLLTK